MTDEPAIEPDTTTPEIAPATHGWRGFNHGLLASLPLWAATFALWRSGWTPIGDQAVIAWRGWDVLSNHSPLVGQLNRASSQSSHPVFDPGPLLSWAIAAPSHVDAAIGPVVGVMGVATISLVIMCIALARTFGPRISAIVALGALAGSWTLLVPLAGAPIWNAYAPIVPFACLLVIAWLVASGHLEWFAVAVVLASYCTQAHLMFAPTAIALCVLAPILGIIARRRSAEPLGRRWLVTSTAALAVSWSAPVYQELTNHPGNLTLLWQWFFEDHGPTVPWHVVWSFVATTTPPNPNILRPPHLAESFYVPSQTAFTGWIFVTIAIVVALTVWTGATRRSRSFAALAVALTSIITVAWMLSSITMDHGGSLLYCQYAMWPASMMTWFAFGHVAIVDVIPIVKQRLSKRKVVDEIDSDDAKGRRAGSVFEAVTATRLDMVLIAVCLAVTTAYAVQSSGAATMRNGQELQAQAALTDRVVKIVGRPPTKQMRLSVGLPPTGSLTGPSTLAGIGYRLEAIGWHSTVPPRFSGQLDDYHKARPGDSELLFSTTRPSSTAKRIGTVTVPLVKGSRRMGLWIDGPLAQMR